MDKGPFVVDNRTVGSPLPNRMMLGELSERTAPAQTGALQLTGESLDVCIEIPEANALGIDTDSGPF
jgi:hypothetical protein